MADFVPESGRPGVSEPIVTAGHRAGTATTQHEDTWPRRRRRAYGDSRDRTEHLLEHLVDQLHQVGQREVCSAAVLPGSTIKSCVLRLRCRDPGCDHVQQCVVCHAMAVGVDYGTFC